MKCPCGCGNKVPKGIRASRKYYSRRCLTKMTRLGAWSRSHYDMMDKISGRVWVEHPEQTGVYIERS